MEPSRSYAELLLAQKHDTLHSRRGWLVDGAWLGGLAVAGAALRGLAGHPVLSAAVTAYVAAEGLFYLWGKFRLRHLSRLPDDCPDTSRLQTHFERFLDLSEVFCIKQFLSGWFLGAPPEAVLRQNVEEFVCYGFHCKTMQQLEPAERRAIERFVDDVEERWGVRFQPGFNPALPYMAHVWEPLRAYHKPLLMYAITEFLARTAHLLMWLMGFRRHHQGRFSYWLCKRPAAAAAEGDTVVDTLSPPMSPLAAAARPASGLRRRSVALEAVEEAVHHAAEHALDDILTVTSTAAAAVAAQHPPRNGGLLSPRAASLAAPTSAPTPPAPVALTAAAAGAPGRRRVKGDSAIDYADGEQLAAAAAATGTAGDAEPASEAAAAAAEAAEAEAEAASRPSPLSPFRFAAGPAAADEGAAAAPQPQQQPQQQPPGGGTRRDVPIVFLHGVGFGVLPYLHLVRDIMRACGNTPVIMVEVPHVALRLCWEASKVDDVANAVAAMLRRHGYRRACIVAHSYGTFVASRLCQLYPELVHSTCLMDPVSMLTCYPQLLYNFIYKQPSAANFTSFSGAVDLIRFVCSRDLTIAQAFCRKFYWSELMQWPQDLPRRSLIVLSGMDDLVPSELVMAHVKLTGHPAKVMHHPELGHGGVLLNASYQAEMVRNLHAMLLAKPQRAL